jgi:flagellar basal body-associated protein FliL
MDYVVNVLIILFIVVFDPLAICLVLAYNFMKSDLENSESKEVIPPQESTYLDKKIIDNYQDEEIKIEDNVDLIIDKEPENNLENLKDLEKKSEEIKSSVNS